MRKETERILNELQETLACIPEDAVTKITAAIYAHQRIFFSGAGRSGLMLKAFAMRLAQMGRTVYVAGETVTPALQRGDLLILASASGKTPGVCRHATVAREIGADLFVISAAGDSPLADIHPTDVRIAAPDKTEAGASVQPLGTLFEQALLLFCDSAVLALAADSKAMQQRHVNLE